MDQDLLSISSEWWQTMLFSSFITFGIVDSVLIRAAEIATGGGPVFVNITVNMLANFPNQGNTTRSVFYICALHDPHRMRGVGPSSRRNWRRIVFCFRITPIEANSKRGTAGTAILASKVLTFCYF
jgi:hypothetical protein